MKIPDDCKDTIKGLVAADPEVALATCDIPHLDPSDYLREAELDETSLPYCGCFVGVYAWMQECKRGNDTPTYHEVISVVAEGTGIQAWRVSSFGGWCNTPEKDRLAVRYARSLLLA